MLKESKKKLVWALILAMTMSFAGCQPNIDEGPTIITTEKTEASESTSGDPESSASETSASEATEASASGDEIKTKLINIVYDSADGWTKDEDNFKDDEKNCKIKLVIPDGDKNKAEITVTASITDCYGFRKDIKKLGFDQYEYKENNKYELTNVGGVDFLVKDKDGTTKYIGRNEGANMTFGIEIKGDKKSAEKLLDSISFTANDIGNTDGPWYWQGEVYKPVAGSVMIGKKTITAEWVPFEEYIMTDEIFKNDVACLGDKVYIAENGILNKYSFDGKTLKFEKKIDLEDPVEKVVKDKKNKLHVSYFMKDYRVISKDKVVESYKGPRYFETAPDGKWGIDFFTKNETSKIDYSSGAPKSEDLVFKELNSIQYLSIDDNYIYVAGSSSMDDKGHRGFVYDHKGNLKATLQDEDGSGLGCLTFISKIDGGYLGLDGNMRRLILWDDKGNYIGNADDKDLFGTHYPWFCSTDPMPDGGFLTVMTDERPDRSCTELLAYKLSIK